jgi:ATP-dependent RNA helicase DHX29
MTKSFKNPGKALTEQQAKWLDIWQKIFSQEELLQAKAFGPKV